MSDYTPLTPQQTAIYDQLYQVVNDAVDNAISEYTEIDSQGNPRELNILGITEWFRISDLNRVQLCQMLAVTIDRLMVNANE